MTRLLWISRGRTWRYLSDEHEMVHEIKHWARNIKNPTYMASEGTQRLIKSECQRGTEKINL